MLMVLMMTRKTGLSMTKRHLILPDCQVKPEHSTEYLRAIGNYIVEKKPDNIICIGDFADMSSLSSYDIGKKSFEGRRYKNDVEATHKAMKTLLAPLVEYNERARKNHRAVYSPQMDMFLGNHEDRITRAINGDPKLDGTIGIEDLKYADFGWTVHPFLQPHVIDGVAYAHYFVTGLLGRPCSTAQVQLAKKHMSCVSGHQQGYQMHTAHRADGKRLTSIIAGSCYEHDEDYLGPQGNKHWRGIVVLHEVNDGEFDPMFVSLKYLKERYA